MAGEEGGEQRQEVSNKGIEVCWGNSERDKEKDSLLIWSPDCWNLLCLSLSQGGEGGW